MPEIHDPNSDILGTNSNTSTQTAGSSDNSAEAVILKTISNQLEMISKQADTTNALLLKGGLSASNARAAQSEAKNDTTKAKAATKTKKTSDSFRNPSGRGSVGSSIKGSIRGAAESFTDSLEDSLKKEFLDAVGVSNLKKSLSGVLNEMASQIGVEVEDIPAALGQQLGKNIFGAVKNTKAGSASLGKVSNLLESGYKSILGRFDDGVKSFNKKNGTHYFDARTQFASADKFRSAAATEVEPEPSNLAEDASKVAEQAVDASAKVEDFDFSNIVFNVKEAIINVESETTKEEKLKKSLEEKYGTSDINELKKKKLNLTRTDDNKSGGIKPSKVNLPNSKAPELPDSVGEASKLTEQAASNVDVTNVAGDLAGDLSGAGDAVANATSAIGEAASGSTELVATAGTNAAGSLTEVAATSAGMAEGASAASASLAGIGAAAGPLILAVAAVTIGLKLLGPAIEGAKNWIEDAKKAMSRYNSSRKSNLERANQRLEDSVRDMIEAPFEILKDAANEVYDAWDSTLRVINGTQGYSKDDLQDLMASYSQRLRDEGLSSVVNVADMTTNLASVLEAGLSGQVAEEFAYIATKLNAAVPTQDFFQYASTYASLAANAIKDGASQSEAINYANEQLEQFASNVLYASRELSGGFSTGLTDAASLFEEAVKISTAAKTGNASDISGVLTSVSAITGAIAPDLTSGIVDAIVSAATGGNSSEIVALRSLAGSNASNTEFLQDFAEDPQGVFTTLFRNLASLQNMSDDAYMEVAEGLSSIFGLSMDAFARVDFDYLADAVSAMDVNNNSLSENMALLASGQTTTTQEMLKMQQINEYLIDEGLAYVLDNEVARSVQEHMWEEQIARELQETEYAVNLRGSALEFIEGLKKTVDNILNFLNPIGWLIKSVTNLTATMSEAAALEEDLIAVIEEGKVGSGNEDAYYQLTTRNVDLNLTKSWLELLGSSSSYEGVKNWLDNFNNSTTFSGGGWKGFLNGVGIAGTIGALFSASKDYQSTTSSSSASSMSSRAGFSSNYNWGIVSKSAASAIQATSLASTSAFYTADSLSYAISSSVSAQNDLASKIDEMLSEGYIGEYAREGKSYSEFAASAKSLGISDFADALEQVGYKESDVKALYQEYQTIAGSQMESERSETEETFWDNMQTYSEEMRDMFIKDNEYQEQQIALATTANELAQTSNTLMEHTHELIEGANGYLLQIFSTHKAFYDAWCDYYIAHTAYNSAYNYNDVERIKQLSLAQDAASREDTVYALAEALTKNTVDLKDPAVQTNALLSQILIVLNAIMQQNNSVGGGGTSLIESLSALAMGITVTGT